MSLRSLLSPTAPPQKYFTVNLHNAGVGIVWQMKYDSKLRSPSLIQHVQVVNWKKEISKPTDDYTHVVYFILNNFVSVQKGHDESSMTSRP